MTGKRPGERLEPSESFREAIVDWQDAPLAGKVLAFFGCGIDGDDTRPRKLVASEVDGAWHIEPPYVRRWLAVFAIAASAEQEQEYVVIVDDGNGEDARSWTVSDALTLRITEGGYRIIPGFEWRDNVTLPSASLAAAGGLGATTITMSPAVWRAGRTDSFDKPPV